MNSVAKIVVFAAVLLLSACASNKPRSDDFDPEVDRMRDAKRSPLVDFNFGEDDIPKVLLVAVADTYAVPTPVECDVLAAEIESIDMVLGPDLDVLKASSKDADLVAHTFVKAIRGLIPYRGVLRIFTGANRRARRIAAAVAAGGIRRGYLKGLGESRGCVFPAAPKRMTDTMPEQ